MYLQDGHTNHAALSNIALPEKMVDCLQNCLVAKPIKFFKEADVRQEYRFHYGKKKDFDEEQRKQPSVVGWNRAENDETKWERNMELQKIADKSVMAFGKEFYKMDADEKNQYLKHLEAKE